MTPKTKLVPGTHAQAEAFHQGRKDQILKLTGEMGPAHRMENETQDQYKSRRKRNRMVTKAILQGTKFVG